MNILDRLVLWFLGLDIAVISLVVVAMLGLPCLVIVGRAVIKDQWKQEAAQLEGAPVVSTSLIVEIERGEDRGPEDRGPRTEDPRGHEEQPTNKPQNPPIGLYGRSCMHRRACTHQRLCNHR